MSSELILGPHDLAPADRASHASAGSPRGLRIAVTGASGLIGSMLCPALTTGGHQVLRITRSRPGPGQAQWDPDGRGLDPETLRGIDAVVHLAGENIAGARWTRARKRKLLDSRRIGTRLLVEAMIHAPDGPRTLVAASAIGFYGDRGDEPLTETSPAGQGFLAEVCEAWEQAAESAGTAGVRVVRIRTGLVLTRAGGLLQRMLLPFRAGLGGRLGSGQQWMNWISADDLLGAYHHALTRDGLSGPVNAVAPGAVRNVEFTAALGAALRRPAILPIPRIVLRVVFGQMADEAILSSAHVIPAVLQRTGYRFHHETLGAALAHELGIPQVSR